MNQSLKRLGMFPEGRS